jgi:predicted metalloprotease with PDZ domain
MGNLRGGQDGGTRISALVAPGTPAYDAGLEQDDQITAIGGEPVATWTQVQAALNARKPGETVNVEYRHRNGVAASGTMTLKEDPAVEMVLLEDTGGTLTAEQKAFRDSWLGSHAG